MESKSIIMESKSKKNPTPAYVWFKTAALTGLWIAMGMSQVLLSATLPDLRARIGITVEEVGRANIFNGVGGMIGALLSSVADRYKNKSDLLISGFVMVCGLVLAVRPYSTGLWMLSCGMFFEGISWTCINSVGNNVILTLWGEKSAGPIQVLHFGYPIGSMIGPLIAYPFVSQDVENISTNASTEMPNINESQIEIPYLIVACYDIIIGVLFLTFQFVPSKPSKINKSSSDVSVSSWKDVFSPSKWAGGDSRFGVTIILLLMLFYFLLLAAIVGSGLYFPSYAVESDLDYSNQEAALYTSCINLFGALGRCSCIFVAMLLPIQFLFPIAVFGQAFGATLILIWGLQNKLGFVITSSIFTYFSFPVWPTGYSWADRYIVLFAIGIGLTDIATRVSSIIFSYLLGYLYEYVTKESIFYNTVAAAWSLFFLALGMSVIGWKHGSKYENGEKSKSVIDIHEATEDDIDIKDTQITKL